MRIGFWQRVALTVVLIGTILAPVSVCAAKAYSLALGKPLYGVNHLAAHIAVDQLEHGPLTVPAVALLVSGGHSSLLLLEDLPGRLEPPRLVKGLGKA